MTHDELKEYLKEKYGGYSLFEPEHYDEEQMYKIVIASELIVTIFAVSFVWI